MLLLLLLLLLHVWLFETRPQPDWKMTATTRLDFMWLRP
eukprot:COSAG06_NODE_5785_length_3274_cov_1.869921_1_plen_39_part_00